MREAGLGLKAATITPEGADDVGSPNRILREEVDGKVIVRTGRRLPGISPIAGIFYPISVVRMAVDDAYGAKQWREGSSGEPGEVAYRTEHITRSTCRAVSEFAFRTAGKMGARVYGGPKWTVSPVYEGMLKEEMDEAAGRHPDIEYRPVLIDALYAGLISGAADAPLVIPALNRDGDCLSDLVLPMYGSIAGAESMLLAFDDEYDTRVAMAEAPHGTAPALLGKDIANPLAMILACGALLRYAADRHGPDAERASRAVYEATLETIASGCKTPDLGGHAATTEFTTAVWTACGRSSRCGRRSERRRRVPALGLARGPLAGFVADTGGSGRNARFRPTPSVALRTYVPVFEITAARLVGPGRRLPRRPSGRGAGPPT